MGRRLGTGPSYRELFVLPGGALLIDTPGVRRPGLADATGVAEAFADIAELARGCRFADCEHDTEPGCAVRDAVHPDRLASMRKLEREGRTAAERRAHGRRLSRAIRRSSRDRRGGPPS